MGHVTHQSARHFRDPGARQILGAVVLAGAELNRNFDALAEATHVKYGHRPGSSVAGADTARALRAIDALHTELMTLRSEVGRVHCHTSTGSRGQRDLADGLRQLDAALAVFATALHSSDHATKVSHVARATELVGKGKADTKAALERLGRWS